MPCPSGRTFATAPSRVKRPRTTSGPIAGLIQDMLMTTLTNDTKPTAITIAKAVVMVSSHDPSSTLSSRDASCRPADWISMRNGYLPVLRR